MNEEDPNIATLREALGLMATSDGYADDLYLRAHSALDALVTTLAEKTRTVELLDAANKSLIEDIAQLNRGRKELETALAEKEAQLAEMHENLVVSHIAYDRIEARLANRSGDDTGRIQALVARIVELEGKNKRRTH